MDFDKLQELIRIFEASSLGELEIETDNQRVRLTRNAPAPAVHYAMPAPAPHAAEAPSAAEAPAAAAPDPRLVTIDSPMVGTFYTAPAPGEPPFVLPGDTVAPQQVVCIVEAMKIMNEVTAKIEGTVEKVLVENGEPVEFGQPLFAIRPH